MSDEIKLNVNKIKKGIKYFFIGIVIIVVILLGITYLPIYSDDILNKDIDNHSQEIFSQQLPCNVIMEATNEFHIEFSDNSSTDLKINRTSNGDYYILTNTTTDDKIVTIFLNGQCISKTRYYYNEEDSESYLVNQVIEDIPDPREDLPILFWEEVPIKYHYREGYECDKKRKDRIEYALDIIRGDSRQNITFIEDNNYDGGIEIICSDILVGEDKEDEATAGETLLYTIGNEITNAEITIYQINPKYEYCKGYPTTEVHELLHAFGIDHITGRASIMNYIRGHGQECTYMDDKIKDCLKYIYGGLKDETACKKIPFMV